MNEKEKSHKLYLILLFLSPEIFLNFAIYLYKDFVSSYILMTSLDILS